MIAGKKNLIAFVALLLLLAMNGIVPQSYLVLIEMPLIIYICMTREAYLLYPVMLFYYNQLGMFFGISVYRIFSLIFILSVLVHKNYKLELRKGVMCILSIFALYEICVVFNYSPRNAMFTFIDVVAMCLLVIGYLNKNENLVNFFRVFVIVGCIAVFTGIILSNKVETAWSSFNVIINLSRFNATFEDPNYVGFFYNVGVFSIVILDIFKKKWVNILLVCGFSIVIIATLSLSAILGNVIFWIVYLVIDHKMSKKAFIIILGVGTLSVFLFKYGLNNMQDTVAGQLAFRLKEKFFAFEIGDWSTFTTGRTNLSEEHWRYFVNQDLLSMLFGGNLVTTFEANLGGATSIAHNDYIDSLLNIGIIGTGIVGTATICQTVKNFTAYKKTGKREDLFRFMQKIIWYYYLLTITVFLDFRFMIGLFI